VRRFADQLALQMCCCCCCPRRDSAGLLSQRTNNQREMIISYVCVVAKNLTNSVVAKIDKANYKVQTRGCYQVYLKDSSEFAEISNPNPHSIV